MRVSHGRPASVLPRFGRSALFLLTLLAGASSAWASDGAAPGEIDVTPRAASKPRTTAAPADKPIKSAAQSRVTSTTRAADATPTHSIVKTPARTVTLVSATEEDSSDDGDAPKKLKWVPYHKEEEPAAAEEQPAKQKIHKLPAAPRATVKPIPMDLDADDAQPIEASKTTRTALDRDRLREEILRGGSPMVARNRFIKTRQVSFVDDDDDLSDIPAAKPLPAPTRAPEPRRAPPREPRQELEDDPSRITEPQPARAIEPDPSRTGLDLGEPGINNEDAIGTPIPSPEYSSNSRSTMADREGCTRDQKDCREALRRLKDNTIDKIDLSIAVSGVEGTDFPCECRLPSDPFMGRCWERTTYTWKAAILCHKPLYFEDVHLERYGHSWNPVLQPFMSGAHFFTSVAFLPYHIGMNLPNECIYTLGYYRPGDCAPYLIDPVPLSIRGALFEAGAITGGVFLFAP